MDLIVTGVNHKTAPIEFREKISFSRSEILNALKEIKKENSLKESLILSTCNRTEIYGCVNTNEVNGEEYIKNFIRKFKKIDTSTNNQYFYTLNSEEAVRHLFKVASGLDSMIVGESQILGQVKEAYALSCEAKANGIILNKLLHWTFRVGKRARTETEIGIGAVSVSSAATELAQKIFKDLSKRSALLIGAGETGELTAQHLKEKEIGELYITNRTFKKAEVLARKLKAKAIPFENMEEIFKRVDVIISSTSSKEYLITADYMKKIMNFRNYQPLFIIDISVPRDFDPKINKIYNVFLHCIDDLQKIVDKNLEKRKGEIPKVLAIIEEEVKKFFQWYRSLKVTPIIKGLQRKIEEIRISELKKNRKYFKEEDWKNLELLTKSMMNKLFHITMIKIKEFNEDSQMGLLRLDTVREIFGLEEYLENEEN
ncbi:glutamyl-tRNA reductase [SCandidatus Aminicenantes bacterium Aminicenantia_JdfR_composite]|jgi:glutamyl-tRNA reductase|nr:glutamyl-tRNA reductase [SCandidatus Aminicenantes bacterium Aminicenantia_JdfR_composite]MCP2598598.1 glutamyl-tRNA reductase [Candidatus Aminicenantes bacterium AC-335-L06]